MSPHGRPTLSHLRELDQTRDEADAAAARAVLKEANAATAMDPALEAGADDEGVSA